MINHRQKIQTASQYILHKNVITNSQSNKFCFKLDKKITKYTKHSNKINKNNANCN